MADGVHGLKAALAIVGVSGGLVDDDGQQVDLFEAEAPLPLPATAKGVSGAKGGRPKGARNRSTEEVVRWFLNQHRSPLSVMANIYGRDTGELVDALQAMADKHVSVKVQQDGTDRVVGAIRVDPIAVLKLQLAAAQAVAPYIHKQQPKALEIEQRQRGLVVLGDFEDGEMVPDDELPRPVPRTVENQGVAEQVERQSDSASVGHEENASGINQLAFRDT